MARPLTDTSHALLGLLSVRPWSTYELAKQVERSLGWFWPRTERKIYDEAKRLVESGHATSEAEATGSRPRTVYRITPSGRRALEEWLGRPSAPPKLESEALARTFFADSGTLEHLHATLDDLAASASARIHVLRELIEVADEPEYPFVKRRHVNAVAWRFQLDYHRMILDWTTWARDQIDTWVSTTDPGDWDWHRALMDAPDG